VPVTLKCEQKTSRFSKSVDAPTINALQEQMESQHTKKTPENAYKIAYGMIGTLTEIRQLY
jgi:hypothetical protein